MRRFIARSLHAALGVACVCLNVPAAAESMRLPGPVSHPAHLDYFCAPIGSSAAPAPQGYHTTLDAVVSTARRLGESESQTMRELASIARCDSLAAWRAAKAPRTAGVHDHEQAAQRHGHPGDAAEHAAPSQSFRGDT